MGLTKTEIRDINWLDNEFDVIINGEPKTIKLSKAAIGCIEDNIILDIDEGKYLEL